MLHTKVYRQFSHTKLVSSYWTMFQNVAINTRASSMPCLRVIYNKNTGQELRSLLRSSVMAVPLLFDANYWHL